MHWGDSGKDTNGGTIPIIPVTDIIYSIICISIEPSDEVYINDKLYINVNSIITTTFIFRTNLTLNLKCLIL